MDTPYVELAIKRVEAVAAIVTRLELGRRAGVNESTIRDLGSPGWTPNAKTLAKLEAAAILIEQEIAAQAEEGAPEAATDEAAA